MNWLASPAPIFCSIIPSGTQTTIVPDRTPLLDVTQGTFCDTSRSSCHLLIFSLVFFYLSNLFSRSVYSFLSAIKSFNSLDSSSAQLASCLGCVYDGFIILSVRRLHRVGRILLGEVSEKADKPGKVDIGLGFIPQLGYPGGSKVCLPR
ncbi:hypothetical protein AVEN_159333-1 [Araneus ventricosus]|uniref:Uncharacterized protein n=1 Tax=Araneus ventricosus TaxID=182803 RepID=A0A4Y2A2T6_ARAVE|nr:hypothetical protein AVEN_159333-1 [Araneus ventricosus]